MSKAVGSLSFEMKVDDSKFTPTLNSMKQEVRNFNQTMKANVSAAKEAGDSLGMYEAKMVGLQQVVEKQKLVQESLERSLKATGARTKENANQFDKAESELAKATATYKNFSNQLDSATTKYERAKTGIDALNKSIDQESKYIDAVIASYRSYGNSAEAAKFKAEALTAQGEKLNAVRKKEAEVLVEVEKKYGSSSTEFLKQTTVLQEATNRYEDNNRAIEKSTKYAASNADALGKMRAQQKSSADVSRTYIEALSAEGKTNQANIAKVDRYKESLAGLRQQYALQVQDLNRMSASSDYSLKELQAQQKYVNETAASYGRMRSSLSEVQKEVDRANPFGISKFATAANGAYNGAVKMQSGFSTAFANIRDKAMSASLGIIGIGAASIKGASMASELQNAYTKTLNLTVTGGEKAAEAQKNVNQMQKDGAQLSVQYGKSQQSIAEGYQELIKRGYTSAAALGSMRSELEASVASGDDFNNVLSVTSQVVDAYGLRVDNAGKMAKNTKDVTNQLAFAADMTATDFQSMGKAMEYVGDSAYNAGFKLSEASSAIGILSNHGLEADKAGTGLRKVINSITGALDSQTAAAQGQAMHVDVLNSKIAEHQRKLEREEAAQKASGKTTKASTKAIQSQKDAIEKLQGQVQATQSGGTNDMLSRLGIRRDQLIDANGNLRDLTSIMAIVNQQTKNMGTAEKNSVFNALFGTTGQQAGIILAQNNKELGELNDKVKNAANGQGYVSELAKKNMQTVKQQVAQFKEAGNAALIMIGKQMLPVISEAAVEMTKAFDSKKGQDGLKAIAKGVAFVADKLVKLVEFIGSHTGEVKIFAATFAGIFAVKKVGDMILMLKSLNETLKITQALSAFGIGSGTPRTVSAGAGKSAARAGVSVVEDVATQTVAQRVAGGSLSRAAAGGAVNVAESAAGAVASKGLMSGISGMLAKALPMAFKALPFAGIAASLLPAITGAFKVSGIKDPNEKAGAKGAIGGNLTGVGLGAGAGAAVGSIIPGVGTAVGAGVGAAIGGIAGSKLGKEFGKNWQESYKKTHPYDIEAALGKGWDKEYKKPSDNMKKFARDYSKQIESLNKTGVIRLSADPKSLEAAKKSTDSTFAAMQKSIDNFYAKKQKSSEKDLQLLVKNGQLTQKQADKILADSKKNDEKKKTAQKKNVEDMQKITSKYYDDAQKLQTGQNSKLMEIANKYGTDSKQYKDAQQKALNKLQDKYNKDMVKAEVKTQDSISTATKIAGQKQADILEDLKNTKGKINAQQAHDAIMASKKEHDTVVKNAEKTRQKSVDEANAKYKDTVAAADQEYYQNGTISKQQHDEIIKNAEAQRKGAVKAAEEQKKDSVKNADETQQKVVDAAERQAGLHKGAIDKETGYVAGGYNDQGQRTANILNGIIKGINGFLNGLHKGWGGIPTIDFKAYATGTRGILTDETALVGEEGFELAHTPGKGLHVLGANGPEIRDLKQGTSILPHAMSKQFLSMVGKLPAHADGVGGMIHDAYGWLKDKIGDTMEFVSKGAAHAWDFFGDKLGFGDLGKGGEYGGGGAALENIQKGWGTQVKDNTIKSIESLFKKYSEESQSAPAGAGVQRWAGQVKQALEMNGLSTSEDMIQKVLRQIQTESGGNEKAIQGNIGDINNRTGNLARGLMQVIPPTFNANKFPGHNDPFNGFDSLLAGLNYAKKTYGPNLSFLGQGHGYANGARITRHQIAEIGEGDKPEYIIPTDKLKRSRALSLTRQLLGEFADDSDVQNEANKNSNISDKTVLSSDIDLSKLETLASQQLQQMSNMINIMGAILEQTVVGNQPMSNVDKARILRDLSSGIGRLVN